MIENQTPLDVKVVFRDGDTSVFPCSAHREIVEGTFQCANKHGRYIIPLDAVWFIHVVVPEDE